MPRMRKLSLGYASSHSSDLPASLTHAFVLKTLLLGNVISVLAECDQALTFSSEASTRHKYIYWNGRTLHDSLAVYRQNLTARKGMLA